VGLSTPCISILQYPPNLGYVAVVARLSSLARIADIAQEQWGLVTRSQLERAGIPRTTMERLTAPDSSLERVAHGVYRLAGTPTPDHLDLRAAWLQLAPGIPVWERETPREGVVSHQSAAAIYGIGHLPADRHEFTVPQRRQTRRPDVRIHVRHIDDGEWIAQQGLPVTRPSRIASDLLWDHEDPEAVGQIVVDAIRRVFDYPGTFAGSLAPHAARFGLRRADGIALLGWLLGLIGDPGTDQWMAAARVHVDRTSAQRAPAMGRGS
jgi:hypothetical protein